MFGEDAKPPKLKTRTRPDPLLLDVQLPCLKPYSWGHMARPANTSQHIKILEYKQKKEGAYERFTEEAREALRKDNFSTKFDRHTEMKRFKNEIKKRVNIKMQEYEDLIDKRREKLRQLFAEEEREHYRETVDIAQRGGETRMDEMKAKIEALIANREVEREKVVQEKRLLQYMNRCVDLRSRVTQKNLIESKNGQLQQIRENQARREAEREMDELWHEVKLKDMQAKKDREEHEAIERYIRERADIAAWEKQLRGKEMLKEQEQKIIEEDRIELEKLREQLKKEEIEALWAKERKRQQIEKDLRDQLEIQEKFLAQRKKEEDAVTNAYTLLTQMELDRERSKIANTAIVVKKEMSQYRSYLDDLHRQRQEEENQLNQLMDVFKQGLQKKQDEARCKIVLAKRKLQEDVMKGRAEQVKYKHELAEEQLKLQQADNEMMRIACETNARLIAEMDSKVHEAKMKYQHDLLKQIQYNKLLQEREAEELEKQLAIGIEEEERYIRMTAELCSIDMSSKKHPFRMVIEKPDCHCPPIEKNF